PNPQLVGKSATYIAEKAGVRVPPDTKVLLAPLDGDGRDFPLSIEKLCPVLSYYVVRDWREGCERCKEILRYGGMGHTMAIHSQNEQVILEFGLRKPAFRIVVNSPTTFGSIGLSTGLDPAMTLGCGGYGGNITSDNITPRHLLNIKRLAYEITPVANRFERRGSTSADDGSSPPRRVGIAVNELSARIDRFLGARGYRATSAPADRDPAAGIAEPAPPPLPGGAPVAVEAPTVAVDFVCEEDVRAAIRTGTTIHLSERAIITPAARDLGEAHRVFQAAPWRREGAR
ncbi:MAG: hypothetical protein AB7N65_13330, partial [Vicinamibacterales bacterium]